MLFESKFHLSCAILLTLLHLEFGHMMIISYKSHLASRPTCRSSCYKVMTHSEMLTFLDWNEKFKSKIYPTQSLWHDSFARETEFNLLIYIFNNFWPEFNLPADMHFDRRGTAVLILGPNGFFTLTSSVFRKFVGIAILIFSSLIFPRPKIHLYLKEKILSLLRVWIWTKSLQKIQLQKCWTLLVVGSF